MPIRILAVMFLLPWNILLAQASRPTFRSAVGGGLEYIGFEVKFSKKIMELPPGARIGSAEDIDDGQPEVKKFFRRLGHEYGELQLIKQVPNAIWGDTVRYLPSTGQVVRVPDISQLYYVKLGDYAKLASILAELRSMPGVAYVHSPVEAVATGQGPPDDPEFSSQWNLSFIQAQKAWDITSGSSGITIAMIENTGNLPGGGHPYKLHPDFIDDSENSKWDFEKGLQSGGTDHHSTMVAGILGAATDNQTGIASLGRNVKISNYVWTVGEGGLQEGFLPQRIYDAVNDGNKVINCSFLTYVTVQLPGGCRIRDYGQSFQSVIDAINYALLNNVVVVAGFGNDKSAVVDHGTCTPEQIDEYFPYGSQPASIPGVIAVSASNEADEWGRPGYTYNYGPRVDIAAPGVNVLSTTNGGAYSTDYGTSFSSPHVAALAGLIKSLDPNETPSNVKQAIISTADQVGQFSYPNGRNDYMGYGRMNAHKALLQMVDNFAAQGRTNMVNATAANSQRKLIRESSGKIHQVFTSGNKVFYRHSTNGGTTWNVNHRISPVAGFEGAPAIAYSGSNIYVAWQSFNEGEWEIKFSRSTNGGSTWQSLGNNLPVQIIAPNHPGAGPLPALAYYGGWLSMVYQTYSGLSYARSSDGGSNWSGGSVPYTSPNHNSPSVAAYSTYWSSPQTNVVYATAFQGSPPSMVYNYFEPQYASWGTPINISSIVPEVSGHANPTIGVSTDETSGNKIQHVAWDVQNYAYHGPSIVYRQGQFRSFGSVYSVFYYQSQDHPSITGLAGNKAALVFQNTNGGIWKKTYNGSTWTGQTFVGNGNHAQISSGSPSAKYMWTEGTSSPFNVKVSTETLSKTSGDQTIALNYSRAISLTNHSTGAFFTLEIEVVGEDRESPVWASSVPDTASLNISETLNALSLSVSSVEIGAEIPVRIRVASKLKSSLSGSVPRSLAMSVESPTSREEIATISLLSLADLADGELHSYQTILSRDQVLSGRKSVILRPKLSGIDLSGTLEVGFGHIYGTSDGGTARTITPTLSSHDFSNGIPSEFIVEESFPQPFNPSTTIRFGLPEASEVEISIVDLQGRIVETLAGGSKTAGFHEINWNATSHASGVYICRIEATTNSGNSFQRSLKLVLTK